MHSSMSRCPGVLVVRAKVTCICCKPQICGPLFSLNKRPTCTYTCDTAESSAMLLLRIVFLLFSFAYVHGLGLLTGAIGAAVVSFLGLGVKNYIGSQCQWSLKDGRAFDLKYNLTNKLHGQPLVSGRVFSSVIRHIESENPRKPLVLSFHGPTGTGKNYAAKIIASAVTVQKSQLEVISCLNLCSCNSASMVDCPAETTMMCRMKLQERIRNKLKSCDRTIFVLDELENLPPGIIDGIMHFLDYSVDSKEYDHRKSIFIFLTNVGASTVIKMVYDAYIKGEHRKDISFAQLHEALNQAAFNEANGFMKSKLILKDYIDHMIPFFPLEREHVEKCIVDYTTECYGKKADEKLIKQVLTEIKWIPSDGQIYSRTGCKKIQGKVDIHIDPSLNKIC